MVEHVDRWLESLGLGKYAALFADNEITADVLPDLTDAELKELGVPLGARKKIIKAARATTDQEQRPGLAESSAAVAPFTPAQAERRQLTVMFVDLVGSTALAERLDPEDMGALLRAYQNVVAGEILRLEGHVANLMGDGVLAYFGWPRAHEDEVERAIRTALAILDAVPKLTTIESQPLACRIGIATGLVVVGNLVSDGSAQEDTVVGETPNLAARLQALAEPGQVVVSETTRRLLGAGFVLDHLGEHVLKGIEHPVAAFAVSGERVLASRFEARGERLQPMVGRDQELALLLERWVQAKAGEGQVVLLVGEAGIGKSRITRALLDALSPEPHTRIRYQCSAFHTGSALWPAIQQLEQAAGFAADDPFDTRLDKLEAALGGERASDAAPLLARLIGLDGTARYGVMELTPTLLRARTLEVLVRQLLALAAAQPVLLVVEDAHWADPTTLELIEAWLDAIATARVLLVLTSRPDNQPSLAAHPHVTRLGLNRLGRAGVAAIVARLGGNELPLATLDAIIDRTDGVPLYVEELTKAILETGEATIPASLHDSLMARLDHLADVKETAQIAACIGRKFDQSLLAAVTERTEVELQAALDRLVQAELFFRRGIPPDASYSFKHALLRDAAHASMLNSKRRAIHERLARCLEAQVLKIGDTEPEVLALHFAEAGLPEAAARYWVMAGHRAVERSANLEAIQHLLKALDVLAELPPSPDRRQQVVDLLMTLGSAYTATKGFGAPEVEQTYQRVRELCRSMGEARRARPALQGLRVLYMVRGDLKAAAALGEELLRDGSGSPLHQFEGETALGVVDVFGGRLESAVDRLERARGLVDHARQVSLVQQPTGSLEVVCLGHLSGVLYLTGYPERSSELRAEALRIARSYAHPFTLAQALGCTSNVNAVRSLATDLETASELLAIAEEHSFDFWKAWGRAWCGWARVNAGAPERGLRELRRSLAEAEAMGAEMIVAQILVPLAVTLGRLRKINEAQALLERQRRTATRTGIKFWDPLVHLAETDLYRLSPKPEWQAFEAGLERALAVARSQHSRMLELRAARDLARLWAERGERQRALDLLAPVYNWFSEGFDMPDLVEARELLDRLG